jgi:hypothetical protein
MSKNGNYPALVPTLKECVVIKMKNLNTEIEYPNISVDGWSDSTARPFNGYVCQEIDSDWNLQTLPIEFKHMKGKKKYVISLNKKFILSR